MKPSFYQYSYEDLQKIFEENNLSPSGVDLLYGHYYRDKKVGPCREGLALKTQRFLEENMSFELPKIKIAQESQDQTVKFLFELKDNLTIESVLIPFQQKYALCLSSQVGCAMQCSFCHTGTQGLKRHLAPEEIVGQFLEAWRWLVTHRPTAPKILNLVYMGQGEPLHNFDSVKKANEIFLCRRGTSLATLRITVSTAGHLPGLMRWKEEMPGVNIALSLHSPDEAKRNQLIPINQRYPLPQVLKALDEIPLKRKQFITFEYLLLKNFNDSPEDAHATGKLLKGKTALVNLIPFNPYPGAGFDRPETKRIEEFQTIVASYGLPTMIRTTKGDDILAACGQLKTFNESGFLKRKNNTESPQELHSNELHAQ